jgi:outer membrane receptor protein involved in Fe transport
MRIKTLSTLIAASLFSTAAFADSAPSVEVELDSITVNADLRDSSLEDLAVSTTVLNELELQDRGASHFGDVLLQLPNVNFSGEGSRPRHIQIRGMGERDDYTGAPNASVGFAIDDIDFSLIGMAANLFDVQQVEVLRGSQGTRYGAYALAGLVNVKSNDPTPHRQSLLEVTAGEDDLREIGLMTSGSFDESDAKAPLYRFSIFKHDSDGFRKNQFLSKDDTNGRDELFLRGKLHFNLTDTSTLDLTLMHADLDNGYDVWNLNNDFITDSDQPGKDKQRSTAAAIKLTMDGHSAYTLTSITTLAQTDMQYSYDGDWVDINYYGTPFVYAYDNHKERDTFSQEFRFVSKSASRLFNGSTDWTAGIYYSRHDEENDTYEDYDGSGFFLSKSTDFEANDLAIYTQLDHHISKSTTLSGGMRYQYNDQDFKNASNVEFSPDDHLIGGHISLTHNITVQHKTYATISRGFKSGGFNAELSGAAPSDAFLTYDKETAWNYEIGLRSSLFENDLKTNIAVFYTDRKDPQFDGYSYVGPVYSFFTENLDKAENYGIEADFNWQASESLNIFGSLGLLNTNVEGQPLNSQFTMSGRDQAHAPSYQYNIGTSYRTNSGFFARIDVTGVDAFYYDNVHDMKSDNYTITNARIGYEVEKWEVYLWAKNLFDADYTTRGFFIANEPTYTIKETYERLGDPRQIGVTASMRF